jgi:hypothetical protein
MFNGQEEARFQQLVSEVFISDLLENIFFEK